MRVKYSISTNFPADRNFKEITQLMQFVCVCESFLNKVWSSLIWLKSTEFSKQERKSMFDQSKVKPYLTKA
jgi:hypothetical protein